MIACQRLGRATAFQCNGVAHPAVTDDFEAGRDITYLAGRERGGGLQAGGEVAQLRRLGSLVIGEHAQAVRAPDLAIHHAHVRYHALVHIVVRVEDQGAQGGIRLSAGRGHLLDYSL